MDLTEMDPVPVFLPLIHPNDSDGDHIINFFRSVQEEDPILAKRLMASHWESVEHEAPFPSSSVLPSSHPASKPADLLPASFGHTSLQPAPWMAHKQPAPQSLRVGVVSLQPANHQHCHSASSPDIPAQMTLLEYFCYQASKTASKEPASLQPAGPEPTPAQNPLLGTHLALGGPCSTKLNS
eukprot:superscaffoldBa00016327_g26825